MAGTTHWEPGEEISGRYVIEAHLGGGGMGELYRARQHGLDRPVAIKTIRRELTKRIDSLERFRREGKVLAKLTHPHVVTVHDLGEHDGFHYLVLELLVGETLEARLRREARLSERDLCAVMLQTCAGVLAAHDKNVHHRDLKPDNLFLRGAVGGPPELTVIDFGIASLDGSCTETGIVLGTPHYMAPEQWSGAGNATAASDQYALGCIAYRAATGQLPFPIKVEGANYAPLCCAVQAGRYEPIPGLRADLSPALVEVIHRMLAVDPGRRFPSMREVGAALLPLADEETRARCARWFRAVNAPPMAAPEAPPSGPSAPVAPTMTLPPGVIAVPPPTTSRSSRRNSALAAAVAVLTVLVVGVWAVERRRHAAVSAQVERRPHGPVAPSLVIVAPTPAPPPPVVVAPTPQPVRLSAPPPTEVVPVERRPPAAPPRTSTPRPGPRPHRNCRDANGVNRCL